MVLTLSELLVRDLEIEYDDSPIVDWYFNNLSILWIHCNKWKYIQWSTLLTSIGAKYINSKNELMPYLQQKIGGKVKLVEMRKLRRI